MIIQAKNRQIGQLIVENSGDEPRPSPLLDADFDGMADILAEDLISELGNDGRGITNPEAHEGNCWGDTSGAPD